MLNKALGLSERKSLIDQGMPWALLPVVLFIPVVGYLTVCPSSSAPISLIVVLSIFVGSEVRGLWKLVRAIDWRFKKEADVPEIFALPTVILGSIVLCASFYGLLSLMLNHN